MLCWEGEHLALAAVSSVFVLFYLVINPIVNAKILWLSRERTNHAGFNRRFDFLYKKFNRCARAHACVPAGCAPAHLRARAHAHTCAPSLHVCERSTPVCAYVCTSVCACTCVSVCMCACVCGNGRQVCRRIGMQAHERRNLYTCVCMLVICFVRQVLVPSCGDGEKDCNCLHTLSCYRPNAACSVYAGVRGPRSLHAWAVFSSAVPRQLQQRLALLAPTCYSVLLSWWAAT